MPEIEIGSGYLQVADRVHNAILKMLEKPEYQHDEMAYVHIFWRSNGAKEAFVTVEIVRTEDQFLDEILTIEEEEQHLEIAKVVACAHSRGLTEVWIAVVITKDLRKRAGIVEDDDEEPSEDPDTTLARWEWRERPTTDLAI